MSARVECRLLGRWRIVATGFWDPAYLDLVAPARLVIGADGHGEMAFGALEAGLRLAYGHSDVAFDWEGSDEMDEVRGSGSAELLEDGSLEIELDDYLGHDTVLKAIRDTSSAAC